MEKDPGSDQGEPRLYTAQNRTFARQSTVNVQLQGWEFCIKKMQPFCFVDFCWKALI